MTRRVRAAAAVFVVAVGAGTVLDKAAPRPSPTPGLLVADLHVHPFPGDGTLTVGQLRREAARRGVDVIAITPHNNRVALQLSRMAETDPDGPIVIPGQEVTTPRYHLVALGIDRLIDWRLPPAGAIEAVHAQGGLAVAAHPTSSGWGDEARAALDGSEVMHPGRLQSPKRARQLDEFFASARGRQPALAPIGSTDFHAIAPLGLCRTYLLAAERSSAAALQAVRDGRAVAQCGEGPLAGAPEVVAAVRSHPVPQAMPGPSLVERAAALLALVALAAAILPTRAK